MNVRILYSNHRHVSATRAVFFRVARTRIQPQLSCVAVSPHVKQYIILVKLNLSKILFLLPCRRPHESPKYVGGYCNKLTFIPSSAFVGLFKQIIYLINVRNMEHIELIDWSLYGAYSRRSCSLFHTTCFDNVQGLVRYYCSLHH